MAVGISTRYYCGDEERRATLAQALANGVTINGIDFLEVIDTELIDTPAEASRQQILLVQCYATTGVAAISAENIRIEGGVRVTPIGLRWVHLLDDITAGAPIEIPAAERNFLAAYRSAEIPRDRILAVGTDADGDYATYTLRLSQAGETAPLDGFDPRLSAVDFSFKVECPSDFDCLADTYCPPPDLSEPTIDYLAKDYTSFRQLMLDRMSTIVPNWQERSPADLGVALVELLAYVGDQLSYLQDATATEGYLEKARQRISLGRLIRLMDYFLGEGVNARTWIAFEVEPGGGADGASLPGPDISQNQPGTMLLTRVPGRQLNVDAGDLSHALRTGAEVFETLHDITLQASLNRIEFYTWGDRECCLPVGSTRATLRGPLPDLQVGDFLLFEEVLGPQTGDAADADPEHRHIVRITSIETGNDPLIENPGDPPVEVVEIQWNQADELPFALCLSAITDEEHGSQFLSAASVARGNVVAADHGRAIVDEALDLATGDRRSFRPKLAEGPLTHAVAVAEGYFAIAGLVPDNWLPARNLMKYEQKDARPAVRLISETGEPWVAVADLLASDRFAAEFVAEIDNDGRARLRFGDDVHGKTPADGTRFHATYRIGNGVAGNVGRDTIVHIVNGPTGIAKIRNPLPATGGVEPEGMAQARRDAPYAFRIQERAVTADDYARAAERHPEVQRAAARFRWTGSWYTVFVSIDRTNGLAVDAGFEEHLRSHLNRFRMAGFDLEINGPRFVPLDILMKVCVAPGYFRDEVRIALLEAFSNRRLADGNLGFFHPDNWTFAQAVYLSRIYATAVKVPGVDSVNVERFKRWAQAAQTEIEDGVLPIGRFEIVRLDNDPSLRENGLLELNLVGGL
jgi:hypothetical protein